MSNLEGKTVLITGPTAGIGKQTAHALATQHASLVLLCRDTVRGEKVAAELRATGAPATDVIACDVASLASVRTAAAAVRARHPKLHVLLNNAGGYFNRRELTVDGFERSLGTNHLGPFLLTNLLLPNVLAAGSTADPARIVNVASAAHAWGKIHWNDPMLEHGYVHMLAYAQSKLANVLFANELSHRLAGKGVTANSLHPGAVASNFGAAAGGLFGFGFKLVTPFLISEEKGARTSIWAASSPEAAAFSGEYFVKCAVGKAARAGRDPESAARLWALSAALVKLAD